MGKVHLPADEHTLSGFEGPGDGLPNMSVDLLAISGGDKLEKQGDDDQQRDGYDDTCPVHVIPAGEDEVYRVAYGN